MRVLVVDDSTLFRKVVRDALTAQPDVEVVGVAADGRVAIEKIEQLKPDLVTLDVEMPELDGLGVLREMQRLHLEAQVIMVSACTTSAATQTAQALRLGAFDFILKPSEKTLEMNVARLRAELEPKVRVLVGRERVAQATRGVAQLRANSAPAAGKITAIAPPCRIPHRRPKVVAIGVSTGGPAALAELLPKLPASFPVPVVIVQHMPPLFTRSLAEDLDRHCALSVCEARDGEALQAGVAYIAPGGRQMKVVGTETRSLIQVTDDPLERSCRPSVDYLFRSLAQLYGSAVLAVVLTGMGDDGAEGCGILKAIGAQVAAQDQASCVVYGMPRQVVEAGFADVVSPLGEMHNTILKAIGAGGVR